MVFLGEVEHWSVRARRAASDPGYDVTAEIALPVSLPGWVNVEPCPGPHLKAMLDAAHVQPEHRAMPRQADLRPLEHRPMGPTTRRPSWPAG